RNFFLGMDKDTEVRLLESGKYIDALNVHLTSFGGNNKLSITNDKGNTLVSYSLPTGINKVIGGLDDKLNRAVYYMVYNSNTNHLILKYNYKTQTITKIGGGAA